MESKTFQCFNEVIVEPSGYSGPWLVLKEMKSLSENIGLPVRAKFQHRELLITSKTDIALQQGNSNLSRDTLELKGDTIRKDVCLITAL